MKNIYITLLVLLFGFKATAQNDTLISIGKDTIKLGNLKIIKNQNNGKDWKAILEEGDFETTKLFYGKKKSDNLKNIQTSWFDFDLGLVNYLDETKYAENKSFSAPVMGQPMTKSKMQLKNSKSTTVNIWVFQQKMNLYNHKLYFKYGAGFEMFNLRHEYGIDYRKDAPMSISYNDSVYKKNKLFVSYVTIPLLLNYKYKLKNSKDISISGGLNVGYLFKATNKQISNSLGKEKYESDFTLNDFKISGVFEFGMGGINFFATSSLTNMLDKKIAINQSLYPYTFGLRFSKL